jgi:hypothetical protein
MARSMLIPAIIIVLAVLACIASIKGYEYWRGLTADSFEKTALCIIVVGVIAFSEPGWLALLTHELLDHFELPNTILQADRLTAPDGRVFILSRPIERVQRYGPDGFEKGFLVGKASSSAMSASGNILTCSPGGELFTFTPDGDLVQPRDSCRDGLGRSFLSYPRNAKVPAIAFNWFSAVAVPLWHPVLGWIIAAFGYLLLKSSWS